MAAFSDQNCLVGVGPWEWEFRELVALDRAQNGPVSISLFIDPDITSLDPIEREELFASALQAFAEALELAEL